VQVFDADGKSLRSFGRAAAGDGELIIGPVRRDSTWAIAVVATSSTSALVL